MRLEDFKNKYEYQSCVIAATGPSIVSLNPRLRSGITIGVNKIARYFNPTYLVVIDRFRRGIDHPGREEELGCNLVWDTVVECVFTRWDNGYTSPTVMIECSPINTIGPETIFRKGRIPTFNTATFAAIGLAMYMGFQNIGVIGFDVRGHGIERTIDQLEAALLRLTDYAKKQGQNVWNLSDQSMLTSLEKCSQDDFIRWTDG